MEDVKDGDAGDGDTEDAGDGDVGEMILSGYEG